MASPRRGRARSGRCRRCATTGPTRSSARWPPARAEVEPELAREGAERFRALPGTATQELLLCTDLHAHNVLAAEREPWLVIDPKPFVGDPTYDALQHLLNCEDRLVADPQGLVNRFAGLLGLDAERLLAWLFAYCVVQSVDFPWTLGVARQIRP